MPSIHVPVLVDQVVSLLAGVEAGLLVDATVGLGGHARALLSANPGFRLLGIDRDPAALEVAQQRLASFENRVHLVHSEFSSVPQILSEIGESPVAILADLGCSSLQLYRSERGFSFASDGPLDMRMGREGRSAAELVNEADEEELVRILRQYGEERRAKAIARAIVGRRQEHFFETTGDLSRLIIDILGQRPDRIHPATRSFQAFRIAVNDELGELERFLEPSIRTLKPGGRIGVISFHSLEDRIVKHTLRRLEGHCTCPSGFPVCACSPERVVRVLTKKVVRPDATETSENPRSRSSRFRAAERVGGDS